MSTEAMDEDFGQRACPDNGAGADAEPAGSLATWRRDGFWSASVHACAPLAVWAAQFFGSCVFVAVGCRAQLGAQQVLGIPLLSLCLVAAAAIALAWLALMLSGGNGILRRGRRVFPAGATAFRSGAALLSLVAVAWTTPPMMLMTSCLQ